MNPHSLLPSILWQPRTCFVTLLALELTGCTWANPALISGVVTGEQVSQGYSFPCHLPAMNALTSGLSFGSFIHLSRTPESSHFWVSLCPHQAATVLIFHHGKSHLFLQVMWKHPLRQDIYTQMPTGSQQVAEMGEEGQLRAMGRESRLSSTKGQALTGGCHAKIQASWFTKRGYKSSLS